MTKSLEILLDWELQKALKDANTMASDKLERLAIQLKQGQNMDLSAIIKEIENIQSLLITNSE